MLFNDIDDILGFVLHDAKNKWLTNRAIMKYKYLFNIVKNLH